MSVYLSKIYRETPVGELPLEMRNEVMVALEESLKGLPMDSGAYQQAWETAYNSKVCNLGGSVQFEFVDEQLSYYVVENLRHQQDGTGGFKIDRYNNLQDAIAAFSELPKEYTSAFGASLTGGKFGIGEIDIVHRKNGDVVQVNDFKYIDRWDNPLVRRAVCEINSKLGIEYESDLRLFGDKTVLIPLQPWGEQKLNSYFMDKYLRPVPGAEKEIARRYGDPSMFAPSHPIHTAHLISAINEIYVDGGSGWMKAADFFKKLNSIDEYASPERMKVSSLNINYVDLNGREGQADIQPIQFGLLKKQTIERTAQHPDIDAQIEAANKIRMEQLENRGKDIAVDKSKDFEPASR